VEFSGVASGRICLTEPEIVFVGVTCFAIEMTYRGNVHDFSGD
jgi:hypothetical protein